MKIEGNNISSTASGVLPQPADHPAGGNEAFLKPQAGSGWIVSPWFDLLFVANLLWPLAFLPSYISPSGQPYIQFWMAYFIATPHRWMTLLLASCDPDRRGRRTWLYVLLAVLATVIIAAVRWGTGGFQCLALVYSLVLSWHFATQHAGILRIYSRKSGGGRRWLETWPPRLFIMYVALRVLPGFDVVLQAVGLNTQWVDLAMPAIPVVLLLIELIDFSPRRIPKLIYMASFFGLWGGVLWAAHTRRESLGFALLATVTLVHSVEYLAVTTYYAWRRQTLGSAGMFQRMARNWTAVFTWFVLGCGLLYSFGDQYFVEVWFAVNIWASFLHCGYDGLMWKLRDGATAKVLGVELPSTTTG